MVFGEYSTHDYLKTLGSKNILILKEIFKGSFVSTFLVLMIADVQIKAITIR